MAGITRMMITDEIKGRGADRFTDSTAMQPAADQLYRSFFPTLADDRVEYIRCKGTEFAAGYDKFLGIDIWLTFRNGNILTLQEKFLRTSFDTATVEYMQDWRKGEKGDWFNMKAQLYFVGYQRDGEFRDYRLLHWSKLIDLTQEGKIPWLGPIRNKKDGAKADMVAVAFEKLPAECVARRPLVKSYSSARLVLPADILFG